MSAVESLRNRSGSTEESHEIYGYIVASITLAINAAASTYVTKQTFDYVSQFLHFRGDHRPIQLVIPLGLATCASIPAASASYVSNVGFWQRPLSYLTFIGALFYSLNGTEQLVNIALAICTIFKVRVFRRYRGTNALIKKQEFFEKIQILINASENPLLQVRDGKQLLSLINNVQLSESRIRSNTIQGVSVILACLLTGGQATIDFWLTKKALTKFNFPHSYFKPIAEAMIILPGNVYALVFMGKGIKHYLKGNWSRKTVISLLIGILSITPTLHVGYNTAISELKEKTIAILITILSASKQAIFTGLALSELRQSFYSLLAGSENQLEHDRNILRALSTKLEKYPPNYFTTLASNSFFAPQGSGSGIELRERGAPRQRLSHCAEERIPPSYS